MFHILRKVVVLVFFGFLVCLGAYVYQKRAVFNPLVDLFEVWQLRKGSPTRMVGQVAGQVLKVEDNFGFEMKGGQGLIYNLRLTGLSAPKGPDAHQKTNDPLEEETRRILSQLILSNHIRADLTFLNEHRNGLAVVYMGETNINAAVVEAGLAKVKREYLKGLPWKEQYKLVRAERKAQQKQLGLWSAKLAADAGLR